MNTYLVTGGAGFIGSHIVEALLQQGENVKVIDNFFTGKKEHLAGLLENIELIEGDIRNVETVRNAVKGVDYILHQAALRSVPMSIEDPWAYNEVNKMSPAHLISCSQRVMRGLKGSATELIVSDGGTGLLAATDIVYPYISRQRC